MSATRSEMRATQRNRRFVALDGLRGIAALSVVVYHYTYLFGELYKPAERLPVTFKYGHFGVQLFFLISGYVIYMSARGGKGVRKFAFTRFLRIYPTYFVCLTLACLWSLISSTPGIQVTLQQALVNYTMLARVAGVRQVDGVYWSLVVEIFFYCIIAVLMLRWRDLGTRVIIRFSVAWLVLGTLTTIAEAASGARAAQLVNLVSIGQYCGLFVCGIALFLIRTDGERLGWLALLGALQAGMAEWLLESSGNAVVVLVICAFFALVVMMPDVGPLTWRPLTFLGSISYPLYLIHQNMGYMLLWELHDVIGPWGATAVVLGAALLMAWIIHETIEARFTRWLKPRLAKVVLNER